MVTNQLLAVGWPSKQTQPPCLSRPKKGCHALLRWKFGYFRDTQPQLEMHVVEHGSGSRSWHLGGTADQWWGEGVAGGDIHTLVIAVISKTKQPC